MNEKPNANVGLSFKADGKLPAVIFKGRGIYADFYEKEFRRTHAIPRVVKNPELVEKLSKLPIQSDISPDLYGLLAIFLIHVYSLEAKIKETQLGKST